LQSIQFDYAMVYPLQGVEGTLGTQQISLTTRLGKPPVDPIEQQLIKEKEQRIRAETEARYAIAERDRLKKQLYELTRGTSETEKAKEQEKADNALREAEEQIRKQQEKKTETKRSEQQETLTEYSNALSDYNEKIRRGITLKEKRVFLEEINTKFKNKKIDLSIVRRELSAIKEAQNQAAKDFELSMNFYNRLSEQGASADEKRSMLERIIQKYKDSGINIDPALTAMKALK
jgi:hypothetical protein